MGSGRARKSGRVNVKSGCRTCKIRKIKCDEGYPSCQRCLSTGRVCDGYGIWGGGGNATRPQQALIRGEKAPLVTQPSSPLSVLAPSSEELRCFDWFKSRTAFKLPGTFQSRFWTNLLIQASLSEPAVLHAVLALSSVHRQSFRRADGRDESESLVLGQEHFTIRNYVKAMGDLQPHFMSKDRSSCRIALIACVIFVYFELLRGHFETAQVHLRNGLGIMRDAHMIFSDKDGDLRLKPGLALTDQWIIEAFTRLQLQTELLSQTHQRSDLTLHVPDVEFSVSSFSTLQESWKELEKLFNEIFSMARLGHKYLSSGYELHQIPLMLQDRFRRIQKGLSRWLEMFESFKKSLTGQRPPEEPKATGLMVCYHTMANIMAETALSPGDESAFDSQNHRFEIMLGQLAALKSISTFTIAPLPDNMVDISRSIIDLGWIPLLYYMAIKCRVHRIRLQAIRLLEFCSHREGLWDARTAARIGRKVMEIEERDFYDYDHDEDEVDLNSPPEPKRLPPPSLPELFRIRDVDVELLGSPTDTLRLSYQKYQTGKGWLKEVQEFGLHERKWKEKE